MIKFTSRALQQSQNPPKQPAGRVRNHLQISRPLRTTEECCASGAPSIAHGADLATSSRERGTLVVIVQLPKPISHFEVDVVGRIDGLRNAIYPLDSALRRHLGSSWISSILQNFG